MPNFRKKPVVIQAALFDGERVGEITDGAKVLAPSCPSWFPAVVRTVTDKRDAVMVLREGEVVAFQDRLLIGTLEGVHEAKPGDWIIRGVQGEIYPCKPDIFAETYEPAP